MMMLAKTGNLSSVRADLAKLGHDVERYEATMRDHDRRHGSINAEIVPGAPACWYVVVPKPGMMSQAAAHLMRRRFGIYQPLLTKSRTQFGKMMSYKSPLFPGYLFVFVWGIDAQWTRIANCPGVSRLLMIGDKPAVMRSDYIMDLQREELVSEGLGGYRKRLRSKRSKGAYDRDFRVTMSTKSYWSGIDRLDTQERIGLLHKALSLPS
jgi:transcription antitermination factor NusG